MMGILRSMFAAGAVVFVMTVFVSAQTGPRLELTEIMAGRRTVLLEGRAYSPGGPVALSYSVHGFADDNAKHIAISGEQFSITISSDLSEPGRGFQVDLRAEDAKGAAAAMKAEVRLGYDGKLGYVVYFSSNALQLERTAAGPFTVLSARGVPREAVTEAASRLGRLGRLAKELLGLDRHPSIAVLLYSKDAPDAAAYSMFRGFLDGGYDFTFPTSVGSDGKLPERDYVMDSWVPHELGDHSVRLLSPKRFDIRWLSEGTGDYLQAVWLAGVRPEALELGRDAPAKPADMLDGKWSPDHYACSARFIKGLVLRHPGALKELFGEMAKVPGAAPGEQKVRAALSRIIGSDVTPALRNCKEPL